MQRILAVCLIALISMAFIVSGVPATSAAAAPVSLWPSSAVPATVADPDTAAVELGVKFRADVAGRVTGIRFYKGPQNTGTHTGTLWSNDGQPLATATFANETAGGWQQVNFATPVAITANTTYVASYHAPNGRYAADEGGFARGVDRGPLHAPADGTAGGNGVYKYGPRAFPNESYRATNYWVDVAFVPGEVASTPTATATAPTPSVTPTAPTTPVPTAVTPAPHGQPGPGGAPALLKSYALDPYPQYEIMKYRPRQFATGYAIDDGTGTVTNAGPYAGWDVLNTPNDGINRAMNAPRWLRLQLNRSATLAIVWRDGGSLPGWLASWTPGGAVSIGGSSARTFTRTFPAGAVDLGAVWDTPGLGPSARFTYLVLFAEASGRPSAAPAVPAGRPAPQPNQACPAWVHDTYVTTGPDGKGYPTWHPQIDPVYWCYFGHEHGSDPAFIDPGFYPAYGYAGLAMGMDEAHVGFKGYAFPDEFGNRWYVTHHFGSATNQAACGRFHEVDVTVAARGTSTIVANLHFVGDFGHSETADTHEPYRPSACPNQYQEAAGSPGVRQVNRGRNGYEPWRLGDMHAALGFDSRALILNTRDRIAVCTDLTCDVVRPTGATGTDRFLEAGSGGQGMGLHAGSAGGNAGTFYTDPMGMGFRQAGQSGAVRQYLAPGLNLQLTGSGGLCYDKWGFGQPLVCTSVIDAVPAVRERSVQGPN